MYNRGSEAVIRSMAKICRFWYPDSEIIISTGNIGEILKEVSEADLVLPRYDSQGNISYLLSVIEDADVVLVTGADNYDYVEDGNNKITQINDLIFDKTSGRTILYDCSMSKARMSEQLIEDIDRFSYITVRETNTYDSFCEVFGINKVGLYPDPAFVLPMEKVDYPYGFDDKNTIIINISNLIMGKRFGMPKEIVLENYKQVIDFILNETHFNVLFIQHVINNGYDLEAINALYEKYREEKRVSILQSELLNAMQIKYIISKLRMLVTARTHASIAAYSTNVPTLVMGYSIKSTGIAKDIFGDWEKYVLPVRNIGSSTDLLRLFEGILENELSIRQFLRKKMPEYKKRALDFGKCLLPE